jgi:adenylyltransferase/sulfurtransferase
MERYRRQIIIPSIAEDGQRKIRQAAVLVIGVGGLGSAICPYLVGAGIGKLAIIDADTVALHNLQRQILYREPQIGQSKALLAQQSLQSLNSEVEITAFAELFCRQNAEKFILEADVVVDATDNFQTRYLINDACVALDKPFVYGAIYQLAGQVAVFNHRRGATYRCLFPDEEALTLRPKQEIGVLGILPGMIGCLQVNEVLKLICGYGTLLSDQLLSLNLEDCSTRIFHIPPSEEQRQKAMQSFAGQKT